VMFARDGVLVFVGEEMDDGPRAGSELVDFRKARVMGLEMNENSEAEPGVTRVRLIGIEFRVYTKHLCLNHHSSPQMSMQHRPPPRLRLSLLCPAVKYLLGRSFVDHWRIRAS
jgi:hypothetical protein